MPALVDQTPTHAQLVGFRAAMRAAPGRVDVDARTSHTFGPGFYARTLVLEPGDIIAGKEHATEHLFILTEGEIAIAIAGAAPVRVSAPFQTVAKPGIKVGVALTRCVCTNIHITHETDLAKLEAQLIVPEALEAPTAPEVLS
jgi:hypothetical protein